MFNKPVPPQIVKATPESTNSPATGSSALEKSWGVDVQEQWRALRKVAIHQGVELINKDENYSFSELYNFLIQKRADIAETLHDKFLPEKIKNRRTLKSDITSIPPVGAYADFYNYLAQLYSQNPKEELSFRLRSYVFEGLEGGGCEGLSRVDISYDKGEHQIKYTNIMCLKIEPYDEDIQTGIKTNIREPYVVYYISHTQHQNIPQILEIVESLYRTINQTSDQYAKLNIIKHICWHLSHAMTQYRGSASINEMLVEILLIKNNISYDFSNLTRDKAPMDLIALFSTSPEQFCERFVINPEIESILAVAQAASFSKPR